VDDPGWGVRVLEERPGPEAAPAPPPERSGLRVVAGCLLSTVAALGVGGAVLAVLVVVVLGAIVSSFEGCDVSVGDPGRGVDSQELDVAVAPTEGLTDGATVFVSSTAFRADGIVGVTICLAEAVTERQGVDACDTDGGQRFATTASGELAAVVAVPRVITVGGVAHDCASRPERCLVVAADSGDFDVSGGQPISFAPSLPAVDLVPSSGRPRTVLLPGEVVPAGPVAVGSTVTVRASGLMPGEPILVGQCSETFLQVDPWLACTTTSDEPAAATSALMFRTLTGISTRADGGGRVEVEVPIRASFVPGLASGGAGSIDCTGAPGRCAVVVAAAADTQRSAYLPLTITA